MTNKKGFDLMNPNNIVGGRKFREGGSVLVSASTARFGVLRDIPGRVSLLRRAQTSRCQCQHSSTTTRTTTTAINISTTTTITNPLPRCLSTSTLVPLYHRPSGSLATTIDLSHPSFESIHCSFKEIWIDFDAEEDMYVLADELVGPSRWSQRKVGEASLNNPDWPFCVPAAMESQVLTTSERLSVMSTTHD
ncbi:hypothetical protein ACFX13_047627 [Malus domestica]